MFWAFAKVNNRLAEIYFEGKGSKMRVFAHCYVKMKEYETKREMEQIEDDIVKFKFVYRSKNYRRILS